MNRNHLLNSIASKHEQRRRDALSGVLTDIALAPVSRPKPKAVSVTPKGQHLVNHYRGGFHYFTVAD